MEYREYSQVFRQNDVGDWGLFLEFSGHNLKDYLQYKNKVKWIYFYKCGRGYYNFSGYKHKKGYATGALKGFNLFKQFKGVSLIYAETKTGFTNRELRRLYAWGLRNKIKVAVPECIIY